MAARPSAQKISSEQLAKHLQHGVQPLYIVYGDEPLLALEASSLIRDKARAEGYLERELFFAEPGFDWANLAYASSATSLFASRKLLELRINNGKPGKEGGEALQRFCKDLPPDTVTLIHIAELDWRGKKTAWFLALLEAGIGVEATVVHRTALAQWIAARLRAQQQEADSDTLAFIADRVEGNLMAAHQEVQKLALLLPPGKIPLSAVQEAVIDVARHEVLDLGGVLLEGDRLRMMRHIDGLRGEGAPTPLALWALTEQIRNLAKVLTALQAGRPVAGALREARIFAPLQQNLIQNNIRRITLAQTHAALRHAARIDQIIKGLQSGDVWDELLQLLERFARSPNTRNTPYNTNHIAQAFVQPHALF